MKFFVILSAFLFIGCQRDTSSTDAADPNAALIQKGKSVYGTTCIACHNLNPKLAGALGPELAGSSLELLTLKVLTGQYPAGYTPKVGKTQAKIVMPPMPYLEKEIAAIHAYLSSLK